MKIKGNGENATRLKISLRSVNLRFNHSMVPLNATFMENPVEEPSEVEIIFDDTRELENLISVLESMRVRVYELIGRWDEIRTDTRRTR